MNEPVNSRGNAGILLLLAAGGGAALTFFLDPDRGGRRRALVRDRAVAMLNDTRQAVGKVRRDTRNRAHGWTAKAESLLHHREEDAPDNRTLTERVRARMGHLVSHPRAIEVNAHDGVVELSGPLFEFERDRLLSAIRAVPGVHEVVDQLETYDETEAEEVPSLQGGVRAVSPRFAPLALARGNLAPARRFLLGTLGSALVAYGLAKRDRMGLRTAMVGGGMLARSLAPAPRRAAARLR